MSCKRPNTPRSDPKDIGALNEPLRSAIYTATIDAPRGGLVLVSGFRDPGRQWDLRHARCRGRECDRGCRGYPVTAVPATYNPKTGKWEGGSRHQEGNAADMGGRDLQWLIDHRHEYGLVLTVSSENWHFETGRRDVRSGRVNPQPTRRIIPWPGSTPTSPPAPPEKKGPFMSLTDSQQSTILRAAEHVLNELPKKPYALRDRRDGRVWVISGQGRWWVRNMNALALLVWTGQVAGFGPAGVPVTPPGPEGAAMIDGLVEVQEPAEVAALVAEIADLPDELDPTVPTAG